MRRIIIDTDTASDDACAIIMALRSKTIKVEAITVVAGNVPIDLACKNALISVEKSDTYTPPVYKGAIKPMNKELLTAEFAHGLNGMGDIFLEEPKLSLEKEDAIDAIIRIVKENPNEIELVAIGPLTNLALAMQKNPTIMKKLKGIYIMGGNGIESGNTTPYAEFNFYVDGLAAKIVSNFGIKITQLPWQTCLDGVYIKDNDIERIKNLNSLGKFFVDINSSLIKYSIEHHKINGFVLCDAGIIAIMIEEELALDFVDKGLDVSICDDELYGSQIVNTEIVENYHICTNLDYNGFVNLIIKLLK